jgi:hypothetical protein
MLVVRGSTIPQVSKFCISSTIKPCNLDKWILVWPVQSIHHRQTVLWSCYIIIDINWEPAESNTKQVFIYIQVYSYSLFDIQHRSHLTLYFILSSKAMLRIATVSTWVTNVLDKFTVEFTKLLKLVQHLHCNALLTKFGVKLSRVYS